MPRAVMSAVTAARSSTVGAVYRLILMFDMDDAFPLLRGGTIHA